MSERMKLDDAVGKFGVFYKRSDSKKSYFRNVHASYEEAAAEAVRLLALSTTDPGRAGPQHTFFVVELRAMFSGGPDGLRSQES